MTNATHDEPAEPGAASEHIAPAPRVSVQAFCETVETAAAIQAAGEDRRLSKAHLKIQMGGIAAAVEAYSGSPTPNVVMIETESRGADILGGLDSLSEVCDAGTRVVVIARHNDVLLYRELIRSGVSEYIVLPSSAKNDTISRIVPALTTGTHVSTSKNDVNYVVTEYGVAQLRGKSAKQRARELIAIAHPDFRAELTEQARGLRIL